MTPPRPPVAHPDDAPDAAVVADDDLDGPDFGCIHCQYDGWRHTCCDDLCYGSNEPEWCDFAAPCRHCNKHGERR